MHIVRVLLLGLLLSGCAGLLSVLEDPAAVDRLLRSAEEIAGLDAEEITEARREEMRKACAGLDVADLLGYIPPEVDWRHWCAMVWGEE